MKSIFEVLQVREESKEKVLPPRQEIIKKFVDVINPSRVANGFKPYPPGFIAARMYRKGYDTDSRLMMFYGSCSDAQNFTSFWEWKLKQK